MTPEAWAGVTLARVLRPHGRAGEVAAEILTDFPERLLALREVYLWDGTAAPGRTGGSRAGISRPSLPIAGAVAVLQ